MLLIQNRKCKIKWLISKARREINSSKISKLIQLAKQVTCGERERKRKSKEEAKAERQVKSKVN